MALLFDTHVQKIKYDVLREVAKLAYAGELKPESLLRLPKVIIPDGKPQFRCCIYKERAIIGERIEIALGNGESRSAVEILPIACDECPIDGIMVTEACRGCLAHRCKDNCPKDAIRIVDRRAQIDKTKCVECGKCLASCPYSAIVKRDRPCILACKTKAISMDSATQKAMIDESKCVSCGACVYQCPFGAISDKSNMVDAIRLIRESDGNRKYRVYAVAAPSLASQYPDAAPEQVARGIRELGFYRVVEAAWGADRTAYLEARELAEKGRLISSCCPAFVEYVKKNFPKLIPQISGQLSPMAEISRYLKEADPDCHVVFIGPCIAKKSEVWDTETGRYVDCALTFEEMQAMFSAKGINVAELEGSELEGASYFGRIFARSGGLAEAVGQALKESGTTPEQFTLNPIVCSGITECRTALLKASRGLLKENFIEGMACEGGCIGGPACLSHSGKNAAQIDAYGAAASSKTIGGALRRMEEPEA